MKSESISSRFFVFVQEKFSASNGDSTVLAHYLDKYSSIATESFYVMDLHHRKFCYISPNASFLCGYTVEEAYKLGYGLFPKIVHKDDFSYIEKSYGAILRFLTEAGEERDEIDYFFYTCRLQLNYSFLLKPASIWVYQKIKPVYITARTAYFICTVGISNIQDAIRLYVYYKDRLSYKTYSFTSWQWKPITVEPLSGRESIILLLAREGRRGPEIANDLCISYNTLRQQMTRMYAKLGVHTLQEALILTSSLPLFTDQGQQTIKPEPSVIKKE
jgi:DNA-binding CsgD family transcriptional regulator